MASSTLNLSKLFRFPETVRMLMSLLSAVSKSLNTGQVEPIRHFLEVRLQDKEDRQHLRSTIKSLQTLLTLGLGTAEANPKRQIEAALPAGVVRVRQNGKYVLREVVEPVKAFQDRQSRALRTKSIQTRKTRMKFPVNLSIESLPEKESCSYSHDFPRIDESSYHMSLAHMALAEIDFSRNLPPLLGEPGVETWHQLYNDLMSLDADYDFPDQGGPTAVSLEAAGAFPFIVRSLIKLIPLAIKAIEGLDPPDRPKVLYRVLVNASKVIDGLK